LRFKDIVNRYSIHDARKLVTFLPRGSECIDVTISSPPYWNIKDYGEKNQIGFGQNYSDYLDDIESVFDSVYHATRSTGSLWLVTDTFKQDGELRLLPFDIAARLRKTGWTLQDIIIWQKDRTLPWSHQGKLRNIFEYVSFYTKTKSFKYDLTAVRDITDLKDYWVRYPERYSPQGKTPSRTWAIPIPRQGIWGESGNYLKHACPLPVELIERILKLSSDAGDVVFDPFAGSGVVLATAKAMGRRFVGTDLSRGYRKLFQDEVLPSVLAKHAATSNGRPSNGSDRAKYTSTILALRCLKFPKELVRLYRVQFGSIGIYSLVVVPSRSRKSLVIICCFPKGKGIPGNFLVRARELIGKKPLSKYGMQATVLAVNSPAEVRRATKHLKLRTGRELFLYAKGRFYSWQAKLTVGAQLQESVFVSPGDDEFPRIVSPLGLKMSPRNPLLFEASDDK
jgi:DNA modification methylase